MRNYENALRRETELKEAQEWRRGSKAAPAPFKYRRVEPPSGRRNPKQKAAAFAVAFCFGPSIMKGSVKTQ